MNALLACAACYGQSDSAMAAGMNWGIFSLLVVILGVLGGVAGFFIFLGRRAAMVGGSAAAAASVNGRPANPSNVRTSLNSVAVAPGRPIKPTPTIRPARHARCAGAKSAARFSV